MTSVLLITAAATVYLFGVVNAEDEARALLPASPNNSINGIAEVIYKAYRTCANLETMVCVRKKTLHLLDILSKEKSVPLIGDTLQLVRDPNVNDTSEDGVERSLADSVSKFFHIYRLQIKLPKLTFLQTSEEGRKKNKGYGGLGLMLGGSLLAMGMAALAALAGKALAASMAALMMAAMAALKKGGHGGGHSSYEVITVPSHHHRSFYEEEDHHHDEHHHDDGGSIGHLEHHHDVGGSIGQHEHSHFDEPYQFEQHEHMHTSEIQDHRHGHLQDHISDHILHDPHLLDHRLQEHHIHS